MYIDMLDGKVKLYLLIRTDYEYEGTKGYYELLAEMVPNDVILIKASAG